VVIKGTSCAGAGRIAKHLSCTETNERNELYEVRGVAAEDLYGALREMELVALGTRCQKPFYHASINTPAHERLTDDQRALAIDRLETALGLSGQPRVVVLHRKKDREHCHVVWSRIDLARMRAISDSHNFRKHEQVARELEREFGHARVQGAHVERDGRERPKRTPSHAEMLQAERTGLAVQSVTTIVTDIWRHTDSGQAFANALREAGYALARGNRRDFVVIDPQGGVHSLTRRIEGARAKDIRARMADLDPALLPDVAEARRAQREDAGGQRPSFSAGTRGGHRRSQGGRPAAKPAHGSWARSSPLKPSVHRRFHQAHAAFGHRQHRPPAAPLGLRLKTHEPPFTSHRSISHRGTARHEFRPPQFYARLTPRMHGGPLPFRSSAGLTLARAPPSVGGAWEPPETSQTIRRPRRPATDAGDVRPEKMAASGLDDGDGDTGELGRILSAIAEEVSRDCAAVCQGIKAHFAVRMIAARSTLPRNQIAGTLAALRAERQAALAAVRKRARQELFGRSEAAKAFYGRRHRPVQVRRFPMVRPASGGPTRT
jgi:hypothetical protein